MEIVISNANITQIQADLLVMKHADGFYGADRQVASIIGFDGSVADGQARFLRGRGLAAPDVVFVGVGRLSGFRYQQIQEFGTRAVKLARTCPNPIRHLALTVHGPGYGRAPEFDPDDDEIDIPNFLRVGNPESPFQRSRKVAG